MTDLLGLVGARRGGRRIAVVDDVVNAGSAVGATVRAVRAAGGEPIAIGALVVLGSAFDSDLPVHAVQRLPNPLWSTSDCPLCTDQVPLEYLLG